MKKFLLTITAIFMCIGAYAKTETINWYMDGNTYATTQCETGSDIILPQTPYKYGYTFNGWFGYTPIEYLESTGTQYIDTGVVPNQYTKFRVKINMSEYTGNMIIGYTRGTNDLYRLFNAGGLIYFDYGNHQQRISGGQFSNGTTYDFLVGTQYVQNYETKKIIIGISKNLPFLGTDNMYILKDGAKGKIYLLQIYDNDVLVRDFIPVLDSNNVPCMYDKVEHKFYYNAGTGDFIASPVIGGE